jgi:hypothetical protein
VKKLFGFALLVALTGTAFHALQAQTPPAPTVVSACTGMDEATCGRSDGCTWLPGFKVQGAQEIKGYCRPSPRSLKTRRTPG